MLTWALFPLWRRLRNKVVDSKRAVSFLDMMQNLTQTSLSKISSGGVPSINGGGNSNIYGNSQPMPENFIFEQVDPSLDDDDCDSDTDAAGFGQVNQGHGFQQNASNSGLKPGKKTKGRVKIKMEFIENKLRRYTTFSKRKTGIMKKAYELSTLTGTQVMLLVASETGHVYTFATRKLQPMITSDSGKALIQTCLNSPDPQPGAPPGNALEQRMNPSGFEETDLSCAVGEDEQPKQLINSNMKPVFPMPTPVNSTSTPEQPTGVQPAREVAPAPAVTQVVSQVPSFSFQTAPAATVTKDPSTVPVTSKTVTISANSTPSSTTASNIQTMQIPLIFQQGAAISMLQPNSQALTVAQSSQSQNVLKPASLSQVVSALNTGQTISSSQNNQTGELNTPLPASTPSAINIMQGMTPGIVMYHTPQGIVYATPTQNLHDQNIFNFQQPATAISMTQADQSSGQQIITIPVPVSLSGTPLLQLAPPPSVESSSSETTQVQQPPLKKAKK